MNQINRASVGALFLSTSLALVLPGLAAAQETLVLDEVVISGGVADGYLTKTSRSATKTSTPPEETPATVSVVTAAQMQDQAVHSVAQALRYTPGVAAEYRGASNISDEAYIRGFGYVSRYMDGLSVGSAGFQPDPWLLESVAAVKGPASLLYGQASPGGLIDMTMKKADGSEGTATGLVFGSGSRAGLRLDVARKAGADLSWRLVGLAEQADTQEEGLETRRLMLAPSVRWAPSDRTALTFYGIYQREPDAGYRNFREALGTLEPTRFGYIPADFLVGDPGFERSERTARVVGYEFEHGLGDTTVLRHKLRYARSDWYQRTLVWGRLDESQGLISRTVTEGDTDYRQLHIDNQLEHRFQLGGGQHILLAGVDYQNNRTSEDTTYGTPANPIDWLNPDRGNVAITGVPRGRSHGISRIRQTGVYLQDQAQFGRLHVQAGLRYDWATNDSHDLTNGTRESIDSEALTGRIGLLYEMENGFSPYVSYATSFEPVTQVPQAGEAPFDPTEGRQLEVGVKWANAADNFAVTASVYDLRQTNVLKAVPETSSYEQVGEIRSRGFEVEGQGRLGDQLSILAAYAYNDSRVSKSNNPDEVGTHNDRVPMHQASIWGKYDFANGWDTALGLRYIGKSWARGNAFEVPGVTLVDAAVGYDFGSLDNRYDGLRGQLNVSNLTDEYYTASCASTTACFVGNERQITASLDYKW